MGIGLPMEYKGIYVLHDAFLKWAWFKSLLNPEGRIFAAHDCSELGLIFKINNIQLFISQKLARVNRINLPLQGFPGYIH